MFQMMVNHNLLLKKLEVNGLDAQALNCIQFYLVNRKISTSIGNSHSSPSETSIGVPQCSILGPLLFIVNGNNLSKSLKHCGDVY